MVKTLRNQKGITLIELLAVIVIIGIVAAIAVPAIGSTIKNSQTKADDASLKMIEESALRYALDNDATIFTGTTTSYDTSLSNLTNTGYLNADPKFNDTTKKPSIVRIAKNENGSYAITFPTS